MVAGSPGVCYGSRFGRAASGLAVGRDSGLFLLLEFATAVGFAEGGQDRRGVGRGEMEQPQPAEVRVRGDGGGDGAVGFGVAGDAVWPVAEQDGDDARAAAHAQDRRQSRAARRVGGGDQRRRAGRRQGCFFCLRVRGVGAGGDPDAGQHGGFQVVEGGAERAGDGESGLPGRIAARDQRRCVGGRHEHLGRDCAGTGLCLAEDGEQECPGRCRRAGAGQAEAAESGDVGGDLLPVVHPETDHAGRLRWCRGRAVPRAGTAGLLRWPPRARHHWLHLPPRGWRSARSGVSAGRAARRSSPISGGAGAPGSRLGVMILAGW